jgi:toxin secretion/phage lysis holin
MNKNVWIKDVILGALSVVGSLIAKALGGWDTALQTLVIFMAIDYISGLLIAGIWQKSSKSQTGALESKAGFKGLIKKGLILLVVLIGVQLDLLIGLEAFCRTAIILFFCGNEGLSIVENLGIMGVPLPDFIKTRFEQLKGKGNPPEEDKEQNDNVGDI